VGEGKLGFLTMAILSSPFEEKALEETTKYMLLFRLSK